LVVILDLTGYFRKEMVNVTLALFKSGLLSRIRTRGTDLSVFHDIKDFGESGVETHAHRGVDNNAA
jgi:hypothetical protein